MDDLRILVAIDFSSPSATALHSAERIAQLFGGSITPMHSYRPLNEIYSGPYMFGMGTTTVEDYDNIESTLHDHLSEFSKDNVDEELLESPLVSVGNPAQTIVEEADAYDMVVMSSHGRTGFTRFFLGSVAEKVLRISHVPVLIVNKEREITNLNRILVTTDFSNHSREAFPYAKEVTRKANAQLEVVNIYAYDPEHDNDPDKTKVELREQRLEVLTKEEFHDLGDQVSSTVIVSTNTPHEALLNYNLDNNQDLVIMSTVGRTGIDYLMMGSTTANVVRHVNSPVLSINPKQKTT